MPPATVTCKLPGPFSSSSAEPAKSGVCPRMRNESTYTDTVVLASASPVDEVTDSPGPTAGSASALAGVSRQANSAASTRAVTHAKTRLAAQTRFSAGLSTMQRMHTNAFHYPATMMVTSAAASPTTASVSGSSAVNTAVAGYVPLSKSTFSVPFVM